MSNSDKKILIIEDEEIIVDLISKKLLNEGYNISVARDGEKGVAKAKEERPDLILLDIVMPKLDGFGVMEEIQNSDLEGTPIIIVSNSGEPVELDRAKELGANDWLIKTEFDPQEVLNKVKKQFKE